MAGNSKDAWNDVGEQFSAFGHRLAERYRSLGEEGGESADESRRKFEEAVRSVTQQLDRTFTSLGDTLRDPAAKESLGRAMSSLGGALAVSFSEVGEEIRRRIGSKQGPGEPAAGEDPSEAASPKGESTDGDGGGATGA